MDGDVDFGHTLVAELAGGDGFSGGDLTEDQVATLYLWLARHYPHEDDPDYRGEAHIVGPADQIRHFRNALLSHLSSRGSFEAVVAVQRIMDELPHLDG